MASSSCSISQVWGGAWPCCSTRGEEGTPGSVKEVLMGAGTFLPALHRVTGHSVLLVAVGVELSFGGDAHPQGIVASVSFHTWPGAGELQGLSEMEGQAGRWKQLGGEGG